MNPPRPLYEAALSEETTDKRIEILQSIRQFGSISQAARQVGVSYKAAWQAVDTLSNLAGVPLLDKLVGGAGGGGARLSLAGENLLLAAHSMQKARGEAFKKMESIGHEQSPMLALKGLHIRTSMRNQLPCDLLSLSAKHGALRAGLRLSNGVRIFGLITKESAQLLGLKKGMGLLALFKATAVRVAPVFAKTQGFNVLSASIVRAPAKGLAGEVSLSIGQELNVVGFCAFTKGLAIGSKAMLMFEESSLVIALPE
ncbi:MAG: LysR family transcriptional regulator [Betaproteobacteria bacterium]